MKTILIAVCGLTLLATAYLSVSAWLLHPPGANMGQWRLEALLFAAASVAALLAVTTVQSQPIRYLAIAGGAGVLFAGAAAIYGTLYGSHFEGYALILGAMLLVQGALTLALLAPKIVRPGQ